jgi:outer membrane lipoprotein-sorting protein
MNNALALTCLLLALGPPAFAEDGKRIVAEVQRRSSAKSQQYEGMLQVIDAGGKTSEKRWTYSRLGSHGTSKAIIRFTSPAEVKGVALLIVNFPDRASDQWMWTPAINRERRIATQDRRTRFFGTDFSFEDLEERDVEHDEYVLRGEETIDGDTCWRIDATPRSGKRSQYTRSTLWVRKSNYTFAQIENFNGGTLIRRLRYRDVGAVQGIWTPRTLEMHDLTRSSRTILKLESLKYDVPLRDDQFTIQALQRS